MKDSSAQLQYLEKQLLGSSSQMSDLRTLILTVAPLDVPVLITGETGSGKEVVARLLHECSSRSEKPFVVVNLAAVPAALLESALVGHAKGAFTGADRSHKGLLEAANGGTIFLDEIGGSPPEVQHLLVGVLDRSAIRRIGEVQERPVDVRFVAAAASELGDLARKGMVRLDLLHRISSTVLRAPPLRDRREDIGELAEHFVAEFSRKYGRKHRIEPDALDELKAYDFPGNVRELRNILERAAITSQDGVIRRTALTQATRRERRAESDVETLRAEVNDLRHRLEYAHGHSLLANPIWEGRNFPVEEDYCFVLMPFSESRDLQRVYWDHVKPTLEKRCGLRCERADDIYDISGVMQSVWEGISRARLVVADLTERNPNVFYELGIAHTLGKPVIMLTQSMEFVPFDLRHLRCIVYEYKPGTISKLEDALAKTVITVLSGSRALQRQEVVRE